MSDKKTIVRFAPSPTGMIHIGNARTAILNWLLAVSRQGEFVLRFDDTDPERSKQEFADAIAEDLDWLGIKPHTVVKQSERSAIHDAATQKLKDAGRLYPCYETAEELDKKRGLQRLRGLPPVYDRAALELSDEDHQKLEAEGRKAHWRFLLNPGSVKWHDLVRGEQSIDMSSLSDPVLIREDGSYLYTLPSVVDDIDLNISHVVRGEDHVTNTAVQIQIFEALEGNVPEFAHHSLLVAASGEGLSKRKGALSIASLREDGLEGMAVSSFAATIGTSGPISVFSNMEDLGKSFDIDALGRAPAKFDPQELQALNAKLLHDMPFEAVAERLKAMGVLGDQDFWDAIKGNIEKLEDASFWWEIVSTRLETKETPPEWVQKSADLLPEGELDAFSWKIWTKQLSELNGLKGKQLFQPLRKALTGQEAGPSMANLMPLIGLEEVVRRLQAD